MNRLAVKYLQRGKNSWCYFNSFMKNMCCHCLPWKGGCAGGWMFAGLTRISWNLLGSADMVLGRWEGNRRTRKKAACRGRRPYESLKTIRGAQDNTFTCIHANESLIEYAYICIYYKTRDGPNQINRISIRLMPTTKTINMIFCDVYI